MGYGLVLKLGVGEAGAGLQVILDCGLQGVAGNALLRPERAEAGLAALSALHPLGEVAGVALSDLEAVDWYLTGIDAGSRAVLIAKCPAIAVVVYRDLLEAVLGNLCVRAGLGHGPVAKVVADLQSVLHGRLTPLFKG